MNQDPTDALTSLLPTATDSDRPWLVWYAPGERMELTGRVLHMWQCKIANLLVEEALGADLQAGLLVHLDTGVHWRTITWSCGAWLTGAAVTFTSYTDAKARILPAQGRARHVDVSVAFTPSGLDADAEVQVLVPRESLALRRPGPAPPLTLDGAADVASRADWFPARPFDGHRVAIVSDPAAPVNVQAGAELSRKALATGPNSSTPAADGTDLAVPRTAGGDLRHAGGAVLVRAVTPLEAVRGVLAAWRAERAAVLLSPEADPDLVRSAARQEGTEADC
ncbi:TIGR03089 family protein [Actinomyces qiguomingii]|uniref:TIGR03089 family protein n=1 Tax=Actinomyces qiguomingii TaxID=2057800 RepID=UPI000CA06C21|nr:TIGR03089 family protein [Actinomyces qiguomingii]